MNIKKLTCAILFSLFISNFAKAETYYFKNCELDNKSYENYIIDISKKEINVVLVQNNEIIQKFTDKIKIVEDNRVISEIIESKKIKNFYVQYYLDIKSKSVVRQAYQKKGDGILRPTGNKKKILCKKIKADWNLKKIEKSTDDKEKKEMQETQEKILRKELEKLTSAVKCPGSDPTKWNNCKGIHIDVNKVKYIGKFKDGEIIKGLALYPGNAKYEGDFKNYKPHGQGIFNYSDGSLYFGYWINGKAEGTGTKKWSDGNKYKGEFKNDLPNGKGTFEFSDGTIYSGEFKNGKRHGKGNITYPDGSAYLGQFIDGEEHGQGTCFDENGKNVDCKKDISSTGRDTHNISFTSKKWIKLSDYETESGKGGKIVNQLRENFDTEASTICSENKKMEVLEKKLEVIEIDETPAFGLEPKLKIGIVGVVECK
tara:strand:+ start:1651 stop:2931 length:1281 start_codon:yes stop_codon:yes gene_type:complete